MRGFSSRRKACLAMPAIWCLPAAKMTLKHWKPCPIWGSSDRPIFPPLFAAGTPVVWRRRAAKGHAKSSPVCSRSCWPNWRKRAPPMTVSCALTNSSPRCPPVCRFSHCFNPTRMCSICWSISSIQRRAWRPCSRPIPSWSMHWCRGISLKMCPKNLPISKALWMACVAMCAKRNFALAHAVWPIRQWPRIMGRIIAGLLKPPSAPCMIRRWLILSANMAALRAAIWRWSV